MARFTPGGVLDRNFGVGGQVSLRFGSDLIPTVISAVALQADGKIVAVGDGPSMNAADGASFYIARFLSNGTPDGTFGKGGLVITGINGAFGSVATSVAIQPDGRIVVGGSTNVIQPNSTQVVGAVVRLNPSGSLDRSFGTGGEVEIDQALSVDSLYIRKSGEILAQNVRLFANGNIDPSFTIKGLRSGSYTLQPDGKIIAVNIGNPGVYRLNADGSVDTRFGKNGVVANLFQVSEALAAPNGDIFAIAPGGGFEVERLTSSGAIDTTYGIDGFSQMPSFYGEAEGDSAVVQADGRIIVLGADHFDVTKNPNYSNQTSVPILARFTVNGLLDNSFGYHGTVESPNGISGTINAMVLENNGKILVAGSEESTLPGVVPTDAALACYNPDGTLDATFGVNGVALLRIGNDANYTSLALSPDGTIVAGGYGQSNGVTVFAVVRYLPDGKADHSFGAGSEVLTTLGDRFGQQGHALLVQANGDIVLGGNTLDAAGNPSQMAVVRYLPGGVLDPSFGVAGQAVLSLGSAAASANGMAIDRNGRIILGGSIGGTFGLVRINRLGILDRTFGVNGVTTASFTDNTGQPLQARINAIALDQAGNILVGGVDVIPPDGDIGNINTFFHLLRYLPNGKLDPTFPDGGVLDPNIIAGYSIALEPDGKIVTGGFDGEAAIARFTATGAVDPTLADDELTHVSSPYGPFAPPVTALAIQPDGKILAASGTDIYRVLGS